MSQLLSSLDAQLQAVSDPLRVAEIQVKKSCYLSRTGYFEESRGLIAQLRSRFGGGQNPRISAWIMLAEGVAETFQNVGPTAKDRIARGQLIALAIGDRELGAITSAWKAHIEFETSNFEAMASALSTAFELADPTNHEANSRIAMILANCMYLCGDRASAQGWFMTSREHALAEGDQATIDALLYNRAAFGMANLRAERCFGPLSSELTDLVHLEVSSAENFQSIAKIISLNYLIRVCKARTLMLKEQFEDAVSILRSIRTATPFAKYNFSESIVDLEMVLCLQRMGREQEAIAMFTAIASTDFQGLDIDDRLVVAWTMAELAASNTVFGNSTKLNEEVDGLKSTYLEHKNRLQAIVTKLIEARR